MNGKGSRARPRKVSGSQYAKNWESIFGKDPTELEVFSADLDRAYDIQLRYGQAYFYDEQHRPGLQWFRIMERADYSRLMKLHSERERNESVRQETT